MTVKVEPETFAARPLPATPADRLPPAIDGVSRPGVGGGGTGASLNGAREVTIRPRPRRMPGTEQTTGFVVVSGASSNVERRMTGLLG